MTLKNAGIAAAVLIVAFGLLSVWSARRPHSRGANNTFSRVEPLSESAPVRPEPMIVHEGWVGRDSGTGSLLDGNVPPELQPPAPPPSVTATERTDFEPRTSKLGKGQRITISGGSEGLEVHSEPMPIKTPRP